MVTIYKFGNIAAALHRNHQVLEVKRTKHENNFGHFGRFNRNPESEISKIVLYSQFINHYLRIKEHIEGKATATVTNVMYISCS